MVSPACLCRPGVALSSVGTLALFFFCGGEARTPGLFFGLLSLFYTLARPAADASCVVGVLAFAASDTVQFVAAVQQISPQLTKLALFSRTSTACLLCCSRL